MSNKKRPSKAQKRAAIELIREGAEFIRPYRRSEQRGFSDMPLFKSADAARQISLF